MICFQSAPNSKVEYPLKPVQKIAMMRNIEKMISDALNNYDEVSSNPFKTIIQIIIIQSKLFA